MKFPMKKYMLVLLAILLFSSCVKEERGRATQRGKEICSAWNTTVDAILTDHVNPAFLLNAWINSDEMERYLLEDQYLPDYKIRQIDATTYCFYKGTVPYITINTHGMRLTDENAEWTVTNHTGYSYPFFPYTEEEREVSVLNLGNDQWAITLNSASFPNSYANLTLTLERFNNHTSIFAEEFALSGDGEFAFPAGDMWEFDYGPSGEPVMMHYSIEKPMKNNFEKLKWHEGKLAITVSHSGYDDVNVLMELITEACIGITYRGVTEVWGNLVE